MVETKNRIVHRKHTLYFLTILILAFLVRTCWGLLIEVIPISDSYAYDVFSRNISEHGVYGWRPDQPSAYWAVGTAAVYSTFYTLFGHGYTPIVVFNILVGVFIVAISMLLAKKWFGVEVSYFTGLLLAIWPSQVQFTTVLASELLFNALMLGALSVLLINRFFITRAIAVGFIVALAAYVRPIALLFPFIFAFFLWAKEKNVKKAVQFVVISFLVMLVVVAPWSIRNTNLFDSFVAISTNGGPNFWMGNNPETTGFYQPLPEYVHGLNELERDKLLKEQALSYIKEEPVAFITRTIVKAIRLYERETIGVVWNSSGIEKKFGKEGVRLIKVLSQVYWVGCLILAFIGIWVLYKRTGILLMIHPVLVMIGYITAVHAVIVIQDRYHFPAIPFIAVLAAISLAKLFDKNGKRQIRKVMQNSR